MDKRRGATRKSIDIFINKYLAGYPYLCRALDVSTSGIRVETFAEPVLGTDRYSLALRLPGEEDTLWIWAKPVRVTGREQSLEFLSTSAPVHERLSRYISLS
ncbi:MAG: hypothetical protein RJA70_2486 [Pseudomonadota bacterium]|jgi:hypothetical protein